MTDKPITGRKVLLMFVGFFGVITAVNITMAYQAILTFPGLEVRNSYVASQSFDRRRAAQQALGWDVSADIEGRVLTLHIRDAAGKSVQVSNLAATLGRATNTRQDQNLNFGFDGDAYLAPVVAAPGYWHLRISATADSGTLFDQRLDLQIGNGA